MNTKQIAACALMGAAIYRSVQDYRTVVKTEKAKRRKIKKEEKLQIDALTFAAGKISERIQTGVYDGKTLNDVMNDFEFETILRLSQ